VSAGWMTKDRFPGAGEAEASAFLNQL
jgi:hypothetical protein